ncbi:MAG TPA: tripartite tricarboxylate transporter substrate binding protein [Pseudolabrys sp.]|nr:tripartite tricarboxylate transporter substrate binding protein [Pseudolabrys sp.]
MNRHCSRAAAILGACLAILVVPPAAAQNKYPSRAIDLIVPFAPGGSTGLTARALAQALEERWKVPVRVVSKPGGNTVPAVEEVMRAKPDGYTVLAESPASSSMLEVVVKNLPMKVMDRTFMGLLAQTPMIFIVSPESPLKTLQDVVARARQDSSTLTWTSLGGAGAQDYTFRQFFKALDIDVTKTRSVALKGGAEAPTIVASGHVMVGAGSWSAISPLVGSGKLRAIAVASPERFPATPDVPTTAEAGLPSVKILFWFGVSGPPNLPQDVIDAWDDALKDIAQDPKFHQRIATLGMVPYFHPAAGVAKMVEAEKKVVEDLWSK